MFEYVRVEGVLIIANDKKRRWTSFKCELVKIYENFIRQKNTPRN